MQLMRLQVVALLMIVMGSQIQGSAMAQTPSFLKKMFQSKGSEVAELQDYHGPWLILAQTFNGEEGRNHANAFAKELKAQFKTNVFIMERNLDTDNVLGSMERTRTDKFGRVIEKKVEAKFVNSAPNISYAVLIGEFHTEKDPQIVKLIKEVQKFQPKAKLPGYKRGAAFMTRNPLLPDDYFQAPAVDEFHEQLNRQDWIKYSLLDCKGRFTVRVASFRGAEVISVSATTKLNADEPTNALDKAASKAHKLTEALRKRGVEAYEYHDKFGSYVTVGSFNDLGREIDGQFQYDPQILTIISQFCGYEVVKAKDKITQAEMQTMSVKTEVVRSKDGGRSLIPFDIEGKPIAVPKVNSAGFHRGSLMK
jgi:hypothetical protein